MSANVESCFVVREPAWHKIGIVLPDAPTSKDAIVAAGLDWNVVQEPVYTSKQEQIPNYYANIRDKDNSVLGVVSSKYQIVQNQEAFEFTDHLIDEGLTYESAGSLRNGKCVWMLGRLPETYILGDKVEQYICFTNTFDGSGAIQVICTPTRVVCQNTLNFALNNAKRKWSVRHIGNMESKLLEAKMTLGLISDYTEALKEEAERLASIKVTDDVLEQMLDTIYAIDPEKDSDVRKRRIANFKDNYFTCLKAADIVDFKGTAYAAMMAATDLADHGEPMRRTQNFDENRWATIIQGHPFVDAMYKEILKVA